jgi:hypothetical protein
MRNNRLTRSEQGKLIKALEVHYADFEARKLSQEEAARILTDTCGFEVKTTNIRTALQFMSKPSWSPKRESTTANGWAHGRLDRLEQQVAHLTALVVDLYERLGEPLNSVQVTKQDAAA